MAGFVVAITGGIASGKSAVCALFESLGITVADADLAARAIVAPGQPALAEIAARFGPLMLLADGSLDRARLRERIFSDAAARRELEAITHPRIRAEVAARSARLGGPYQLIAVPLLAETGTADHYDRVLVVDCDPQLQLRRLMSRDQVDAAAAQRMIDAQASRQARLDIADDVITNDGDVGHLAAQVEALHKSYLDAPGYAK